MARASRRGDASYWLANRRKFNDSVDAICRAANQERKMVDTWWLAEKLLGMSTHKEKIIVADVQRDGTILLQITRPMGIQGHTEITIKVVDDE
jgi:hypothetical protein